MKSRQEITDDEIRGFMDFDKLLQQKEKFVARQRQLRNMKIGGATVFVALTGLVFFLYMDHKSDAESPTAQTEQPVTTLQTPELTDTAQSETTNEISPADTEPEADKKEMKRSRQTDSRQPNKQAVEVKPEKPASADEKLSIVYQQPEPVNGYPDLYAYFDKELMYPQTAVKDSIQGVVTVLFSVNAAGKAEDVVIENSLGKPFDEEVLRVLSKMPLWKPAYYNGKLVKSKVSLPLTFELKKVGSKN